MKTDQKDCDTLPSPVEAEQTRTDVEEEAPVKDTIKAEDVVAEPVKEKDAVEKAPEEVKVKAEEKSDKVDEVKKTRQVY